MGRGERIHTRSIKVECYELTEGGLLIEGTLTDERFFPYMIYATQQVEAPGPIHQMVVSMAISLPDMIIHNVEVRMPVIPMPECEETKKTLARLNNLQIRPGLTGEIRKIFGKGAGCLHLTNLVLSMISAAMQGIWAYFSRVRGDRPIEAPDTDLSIMIDSCWMWRQGGPLAKRIAAKQQELREKRAIRG